MRSETPVNLIQELRLRLWARRNYVPAELRRDDEWHPLVLDEMRRRDAEQQELSLAASPVVQVNVMPMMVPLEELPARWDFEPVITTTSRLRLERGSAA